jgi:hypothetical protein
LPGKQAVLRLAEHQFAVEQHFTQDDIGFVRIQASADVGEQSILFFYVFNLSCQPSWLVTVSPGLNITRVTGSHCERTDGFHRWQGRGG